MGDSPAGGRPPERARAFRRHRGAAHSATKLRPEPLPRDSRAGLEAARVADTPAWLPRPASASAPAGSRPRPATTRPAARCPHAALPGHSPQGWAAAAAPGTAAAAAAPAWWGRGPGPGPGWPAPEAVRWEDGRGRRDDSAAAAASQRTQSGLRRRRRPHSRPYKRRAPRLLPVGAGAEGGACGGRGGA